jgi:hypothetical protein
MDYWQSLMTALFGAIAASVVAAGPGFLATRIPRVRKWFVEGALGASLITAFLMSVIVAGTMGLFLRHLTWEEVHPLKQALAGFSIIAGGRVDPTTSGKCDDRKGSSVFLVQKKDEGIYEVCFKSQSLEDSMILTSSVPKSEDNTQGIVSAYVTKINNTSFDVQTLHNGNPADSAFWFIVIRQDAPP